VENLLELDFGAAATEEVVPSPTIANNTTSNILDDLGSLSITSNSPAPPRAMASPVLPSPSGNNMNDLLGLFGAGGQSNGLFGGENVWSDTPQQNGTGAKQEKGKQTNEDILGLF
jgi:hypothetical protein